MRLSLLGHCRGAVLFRSLSNEANHKYCVLPPAHATASPIVLFSLPHLLSVRTVSAEGKGPQ